jgi:DNA modification methylase
MKKIQSIDDLQFDDHNANKGTATGQKLVAKSIEDYGAGRSIVADKHGTVIGGNKTLQAARDAGLDVEVIRTQGDKLIVHQRADLDLTDGDKARLLAYADNRSSELGLEWDAGVLTEDIGKGLDLSGLFDDKALDAIGVESADPEEPPEAQMDAAEELQEKWQVNDGDVWEIGAHRLMCGDFIDHCAKLVGDKFINAVVSDPPYGIGFKYASHDDSRDLWYDLMNSVIPVLRRVADFVIIPCCGIDRMGWWYETHTPDWIVCWYKGSPGHRSHIGFNDWEAHLVWGKPPKQMHDYFQTHCGFNDADGHPCPKPVAWAEWLVERAAEKDGTILDPFLGSGTTMVAAQQLGRKCYGMEIEPKYCAVILERMSDMGLTPELVSNAREEA